jgi:hypothetical protein
MSYDPDKTNYIDLWEQIADAIQNNLSSEDDDSIFRILLPNFNQFMPLLTDSVISQKQREIDLIRFMRNFKAMIRATNAVCVISVDEELMSKWMVNNLIYLSDAVYKITSFKGKLSYLTNPNPHSYRP